MILVTGAAGKTGKSIVSRLAAQGTAVRAWVRRSEQVASLQALGAAEVVVADLLETAVYQQAMAQISAIYHICPNMHPSELEIGQQMIAAAAKAQVQRFIYHSVLHPQTQQMPHHWHKLLVEEKLFEADLPVTILQPAAYMQNIWGSWPSISQQGIYAVPYPVTTRLSVVDLEDVAETAVITLTQPGHNNATYELVGPQALSPQEIAALLSQKLGRPIQAAQISIQQWQAQAKAAGLSQYAIATLTKMFSYYGRYHFQGNPNSLQWLLGRQPTSFSSFIAREMPQP